MMILVLVFRRQFRGVRKSALEALLEGLRNAWQKAFEAPRELLAASSEQTAYWAEIAVGGFLWGLSPAAVED